MREYIEAYLNQTDVSDVSLLSYRMDLERFSFRFPRAEEQVEREALISYFAEEGKRLSPSSLSRRISVVRSFYEYLKRQGVISENPMDGVRASDFSKKEQEVLDREEFDRLMEYSVPGFCGIRDRAMLMLLCETGLRVTELVELELADLSEGNLVCGNGRRRRSLPLSAKCYGTIRKYLAVRELYASPSEQRDPLFITVRGSGMTRQGFWKNLKERAIYCGIEKTISPHTLRRSLALHLMEQGKARGEISSFLGNADPGSLRNYQSRKKEK